MPLSKLERYLTQRRIQTSLPVRLYALVDGLLYGDALGASALERGCTAIALFDDTPDASLADAGPWLIDVEGSAMATRCALLELAAGASGVSWLTTAYQFQSLARELRERLDVLMPDGGTALLRFYDARLVSDITRVLSSSQRAAFFVPTFDWLVQINGELVRVHPDD
ncbi:DUF4123 domain-containing protein [Paraburkholderia sp. BL21I4N1]|uniref:DUF4123 domain-containing protein n=1 Tax=Paraburkholderia sp. BL21I4N1 TaxID=1938801 RepID=UPI000CFC5B90|nr:DUF4123 domain-containing protein [Paraburkholderia sp. BL21I4N1]PQV51059.1 uncharacterized protein DUF4123 [Paraburkholderia sp. BL21I4N1]